LTGPVSLTAGRSVAWDRFAAGKSVTYYTEGEADFSGVSGFQPEPPVPDA